MISLDSETTGLDFKHGTRPFFITTCTHEGEQMWWEWAVDPLTRQVKIPRDDLQEIGEYLFANGPHGPIGDMHGDDANSGLILQNAKFDFTALDTIGFWKQWDIDEAWWSVRDTLIAGHLLASNHPHNLTDMATEYLGVDIEPYEKALEAAVKECRRMVQQAKLKHKRATAKAVKAGDPALVPGNWDGPTEDPLARWAIAEKDRPDMPSAGETCWKADTWLPRAMATHLGIPATGHPQSHYWTVLREYANADSAVTVSLWQAQRKELVRRNLMAIYRERLKLLPVAYRIEQYGVTLSGDRMQAVIEDYEKECDRCEAVCLNIAKSYDYPLDLPAGAVNNSLREFCFNVLKLPPVSNPKSKTAAPTLNKVAMQEYEATLPPTSKAHIFIKSLLAKRRRGTALSYMESYKRFWRPVTLDGCEGPDYQIGDFYRLHPNLNATGTDTLRWSSSNPNEQNISKQEDVCKRCEGKKPDVEACAYCGTTGVEFRSLRYFFGPVPGREWWSMDARGIEDRLPAYKSGQQELIDIFEHPDQPPYYGSNHLLRFHTVYPDIWDAAVAEVGLEKAGPYCKKKYASTYYQWVKNGGFAVQYGAIDRDDGQGTADRAFHKSGAHKLLKVRFSKLEALNQWCIRNAERYGYVETMPRRSVDPDRGYPILCTRTEWGKILPTVPLNYYIQGTACDWMGGAMVRCQEQLDAWREQDGFDGHIVMQVHDELMFDFPKSGAHPSGDLDPAGKRKLKPAKQLRSNLWRARFLQGIMEWGGTDIGIPTPTSLEYHEDNWSEGVSL